MYTPKPNEETRVEVMHELIRSHPLGTWTLLGADDRLTHHVSFLLDADRGPGTHLRGDAGHGELDVEALRRAYDGG